MTVPILETPQETIVRLAQQHGIVSTPQSLDRLAGAITYLAGDDVSQPDDIEMLLIRLRQGKHINNEQFDQLLHDYLTGFDV